MAKTNGTMKIAMLKWDNITVSLENNTAMRVIMTAAGQGDNSRTKDTTARYDHEPSTTIISERCHAATNRQVRAGISGTVLHDWVMRKCGNICMRF